MGLQDMITQRAALGGGMSDGVALGIEARGWWC